mgnify:FL=1
MKSIIKKRIVKLLTILMSIHLMSISNVYAMTNGETSVDEYSELLPKNVDSDRATEQSVRRGEFFARADLIITDEGDGNIGAFAVAYMDHAVDEVYITIYLDRWNDEEERWQMVTYYDAEFYAEDYPEGLTDPTVDITFLNQERDHYYRLRSAFSAVYDNDYEGFSPTTAGIWID